MINQKPELLSPAGSFEALIAAINAGCDAIYLGGEKFGARANANNFNHEQLKEGLDIAHLNKVKVYYTMNTLIKDNEINELLKEVEYLYQLGVDALILQDIGIYNLIHNNIPDFPLHASTQMTVHSLEGAKMIEELGFERVVLSRELSLTEIAEIKEALSIEIECFIHGALCYSYSGQCLMSSIIGGRSGNRGRCAQPCRLPYQLYENNKKLNNSKMYLLSPKDIQTLNILPQLIDCKIDSLKIEGRMKSPTYVGLITSIYRKYIDLYTKNPKGYKVEQNDINDVAQIYNRGGFSNGYYLQKNNPNMMSMKKPNHQGIIVGKVEKALSNKKKVKLKLDKELSKGDCIEVETINGKNAIIILEQDTVNKCLYIKNKNIKEKGIVYQLTNQKLNKFIDDKFVNNMPKILISGKFSAQIGKPYTFEVSYEKFKIKKVGKLVEKAKSSSVTEEEIQKRLNKIGNYPVKFLKIEIDCEEGLFIPLGDINRIKREAIDELISNINNQYRREYKSIQYNIKNKVNNLKRNNVNILIRNLNQYHIIKEFEIDCLYLPLEEFTMKEIKYIIDNNCNNYSIYISIPRIIRNSELIIEKINALKGNFDGFLVSTLDSYKLVEDYKKNIVINYHMNTFNNSTIEFWKQRNVKQITLSPELNKSELSLINDNLAEIVLYGYLPVMITSQCIDLNCSQVCNSNKKVLKIKDRMNNYFHIVKNCEFCFNTIYNSVPLVLIDEYKKINKYNIFNFRVEFLNESNNEINNIMNMLMKVKSNKEIHTDEFETSNFYKGFTRGHFFRGVK